MTTLTSDTSVSTPEAPENEDDKEARRPYVVVLMSAEMKAALKEYADKHETNPTALARKLLAAEIGYDLTGEPVPTRRSVYTSDDERDAAKKIASKKSGLLRKALFQVHTAQLKSKTELLAAANRAVMSLSELEKPTLATLEAMDAELDAAIKAGK